MGSMSWAGKDGQQLDNAQAERERESLSGTWTILIFYKLRDIERTTVEKVRGHYTEVPCSFIRQFCTINSRFIYKI